MGHFVGQIKSFVFICVVLVRNQKSNKILTRFLLSPSCSVFFFLLSLHKTS